ncbi:MAG: hypothetical protein ABI395_06300 [Sphingobium sp.]
MIAMDRPFWKNTALLTALLIWPLLLFGHPPYFFDSVGYYQGGKVGATFIATKLHLAPPPEELQTVPAADTASAPAGNTTASAPAPAADSVHKSKVARSIIYSAMAYVLSWPDMSMALLAVAQAALTALVAAVALAAFGVASWQMALIAGAVLGFLTPAAFVSLFILPDIYAGILVGAMALLVGFRKRMTGPIQTLLVLIGALSVSVHTSHPPLAFAMCCVGGLWLLLRPGDSLAGKFGSIVVMGLPLALGCVLVMLSGLIGFGEASVAPKRFPLTLARAIENGPARWYLAEQCPKRRYAVCEVFGNKMPTTTGKFLWGPHGVVLSATPEQMDRIRAEESEIVWRSTLAYPGEQLEQIAIAIPQQIVAIGMSEIRFNRHIIPDGKGSIRMLVVSKDRDTAVVVVEMLTYISTALASLYLLLSVRKMTAAQRGALLMIVTGLLVNAIICAVFSAVSDRYQSRIIWLVPLFALCLLFGRLRNGPARANA